jgi:membrane protein involved in colicin uptake
MNTDYTRQTERETKMETLREIVIGLLALGALISILFFFMHIEKAEAWNSDTVNYGGVDMSFNQAMQQQQQEMQMQQLQEQQRQMQQQMQYQQQQNEMLRVRPYGSSCIGYGCPSLH